MMLGGAPRYTKSRRILPINPPGTSGIVAVGPQLGAATRGPCPAAGTHRAARWADAPELKVRFLGREDRGAGGVTRNDAHRLIEECMIAGNRKRRS
jgi:hypothetical protein